MKKWITILLCLSLTTALFGDDSHHRKGDHHAGGYLQAELDHLFEDAEDLSLSTIDMGDVQTIWGVLSVAQQKDRHIQHSKRMSFMFPGLGQIKNDDKLSGALFISADIALTAGSLIGAYFLLPADLRFDQLDYFNTPNSTIKQRWESHTFVDMLPTMGVLAGGWLLQGGLRIATVRAGRGEAPDGLFEC